MNTQGKPKPSNPLLHAIISFIEKMRQHPESYPIKYYKKGYQYKRPGRSNIKSIN